MTRTAIGAILLLASWSFSIARPAAAQVVWQIDSTTTIGGNAVTLVRGDPAVVSTPFGNGLAFDGDDGIIVNDNPIVGAATFTIEMLFRPDPIVLATSNQPRVLFIQSMPNPPDHRAALEARIESNNQQWHIDTFLQSQTAGQGNPNIVTPKTLEEPTKVHPLGQWYNYAMTYDGSQLRAYLNGQLESSDSLLVQGMAEGRTSLGMRITQERFFEGVIAKVRFTPSLVDPTDFLSVAVAGDYDGNYVVDAADYAEWKNAFGQSVANPGDGADGNRNGVVDAADYTVWRDHVESAGAASLAASVPEPSSSSILLCVGICGLGRPTARRAPRSFNTGRTRGNKEP